LREITLEPSEFMRFSVPHALYLAGERQYALGLGAIVAAVGLRLRAQVTETQEEFCLDLGPEAIPSPAVERSLWRWREALARVVARDPQELDGLRVSLDLSGTSACCPAEVALGGPAVAVSLVCALRAHRGTERVTEAGELASLGGALLAELPGEGRLRPERFYAECFACLEGGALHVAPGCEPLNVQLLLPPDSLILVVPRAAASAPDATGWEDRLQSGLRKTKGAADLVSATEDDLARLFKAAARPTADKLDDGETAVLYGLLRVREMIQELLEGMGRPLQDHDRFAELCDEESAILKDYFGFNAGQLERVRQQAVESGALGARLTHVFGGPPGLIVIAPGRRGEVRSALARRARDCHVVPVDVDPTGVAAEA